MRFLADVGVSRTLAVELRRRGHEVIHLSEERLHRLPDDEILKLAQQEQRVIAEPRPIPDLQLCPLFSQSVPESALMSPFPHPRPFLPRIVPLYP